MRHSRSSCGCSDCGQQFSRSTPRPPHVGDRERKRISRTFANRNSRCYCEVALTAVCSSVLFPIPSIRFITSDLTLAYSFWPPLAKSCGPYSNSTTNQNVSRKNRPNQQTLRRSHTSEE